MAGIEFDFEGFYQALDATREARGLNWKQVAEATSVHPSTLTRMAQSRRPDADGLAALSAWASLNPADFVKGAPRAGRAPEALARISKMLREDPRLSDASARALEEIFRTAYGQLTRR